MKVLFITSEALPFAASGGLADVSAALPKALRRRFVGCRVVLPLYAGIPQNLRQELRFLTSFTVPLAWRNQYCGVFEGRAGGVTYYLLDNEYYFKREGLYGHYDDAERFAFFARAALELLKYIDFAPDILHCNDWQTALVPVYLRTDYARLPAYGGLKTVFTIHNLQYQGKYTPAILGDVFGLSEREAPLVTYDGCVNLMKGGVECADAVTTVSETYAREILDPWHAHGLHNILRAHGAKLRGIVNGIDTQIYDPETDPALLENYSAEDPAGKAANKKGVQESLGLPAEPDVPLVCMVTRLTGHKGLDLVREAMDELLRRELRMAVLGSGDPEYERFFADAAARYPDKLAFRRGFIPDLARRLYAAADIFLMPSKSEPCGLAQMVALRYGAIPVVRETGGLKDTVSDSGGGSGNGFLFAPYDAASLLHAVGRALESYADKEGWRALMRRAMETDNSWNRSAGKYIGLYESLRKQG